MRIVLERINPHLTLFDLQSKADFLVVRHPRRILCPPLWSDLKRVDHAEFNQFVFSCYEPGFFKHFPRGRLPVSLPFFKRACDRLPESAVTGNAS